jgi:hypothetical protein
MLVIISIAAPPWIGVISEYCATYAFIVALAVMRTGIWQADDVAWLRGSLMDAAKWISGLTGLAALSGLIGLYAHDVAGILKTAMETTFTAFTQIYWGAGLARWLAHQAPHGFAAQQRLVLRSLRAGVEDPVVKRAEIRSIQGLRGRSGARTCLSVWVAICHQTAGLTNSNPDTPQEPDSPGERRPR